MPGADAPFRLCVRPSSCSQQRVVSHAILNQADRSWHQALRPHTDRRPSESLYFSAIFFPSKTGNSCSRSPASCSFLARHILGIACQSAVCVSICWPIRRKPSSLSARPTRGLDGSSSRPDEFDRSGCAEARHNSSLPCWDTAMTYHQSSAALLDRVGSLDSHRLVAYGRASIRCAERSTDVAGRFWLRSSKPAPSPSSSACDSTVRSVPFAAFSNRNSLHPA
jgi:hypothetical protein